MHTPTRVLWGESDRIVDSAYGHVFATAKPMAQFDLLPATGHLPQIETPDSALRAIWDRPLVRPACPGSASFLPLRPGTDAV